MRISHRNRTILIVFFLMFVLVGTTGCRQAETPPPAEPEEPEVEIPVEEPEDPEDPEEEQTSQQDGEILEAQGRYVGFADTRSVEIELINGDYDFMVFQLDDTVRQQLEAEEPDPGIEVTIHFKILEQGQPMITALEVN
ncbi:MAG: hypothetical protein SCK57_02075 [Bacillota bacterium]|nr:hypothetical protein [Bacillota bacterium]MDW7676428.1 hypothetical protein [Bacillota bacterium]